MGSLRSHKVAANVPDLNTTLIHLIIAAAISLAVLGISLMLGLWPWHDIRSGTETTAL
jgi:uncharacterized membrane protein YhaH (DUF805 family)